MENLWEIVEPGANPVSYAFEFLEPVTIRIYGTAETRIVVTRGCFNHFLQGREFLDAEFLETDGIQLELLRKLRDVEHLFFHLADVAVDEIPMQKEVVLRQYRKRVPDLLLGDALLNLFENPIVRGLDSDKEDSEACFPCLVEEPGMFGDVNPGLDNKSFP